MVEKERSASNLDLIGGRLCLDFANTISTRMETGREYLTSYAELAAWSEHAGALAEDEAEALRNHAASHPNLAAGTLERAILFRETVYRIFSAIADGGEPGRADLAALNEALRPALSRLEVNSTGDGFAWRWTLDGNDLDGMLWPLARSAADLLTSEDLKRVRQCARDGCDWLFVDTSKNHSRRWCSMDLCGSRVKAKRYYQRKRKGAAKV